MGPGVALGMHFSVVCAEDLPRAPQAAAPPPAETTAASPTVYERACADWPRGTVPAAFFEIKPAPSPVLLLSGGLDPVTPPRHGARVAQALGAQAVHVVVPNAGHGVMGIGCARDVVYRFIDAEADAAALKVDAGCVTRIPRPAFFQPPGAASGVPTVPEGGR
jgi:pimeloyl-ACP methyl ester carboxylesterase